MSRAVLVAVVLAGSASAQPRLDQHGDPLPEGAIARFGTIRDRIGSVRAAKAWALSPDGKTLAVEDRFGITLWDVDTGKPGMRFPTAVRKVEFPRFALSYSPDGKWLARVGGPLVSVVDAITGKERFSLDLKERGKGQSIAFVPDQPDRLAITLDDRAGALFMDATNGRIERSLETHATLDSLSPTGKHFLSTLGGGPDLVDAATGKYVCSFLDVAGPGGPVWVLSPDDSRLYVARHDGRLQIFDCKTGKKLVDLEAPREWVEIDFHEVIPSVSPDGNTLYLTKHCKQTRRYDVKARKWLDPLPATFGGPILNLPDGKRVLQIGTDGVLRRFDLATRKQLPATEGFESCLLAYTSPDGKRAVFRSEDPAGALLTLIDTAGKVHWTIRNDWADPVWRPDSQALACVRHDRITVLDANTGQTRNVIKTEEENEVFTRAFYSPDGDRLLIFCNDGLAIAVYDTQTGRREKHRLLNSRGAVDLAPDGQSAVFASGSLGLALFDFHTGRLRTDWVDVPKTGDHAWVNRPSFSPDGSYLLTWGTYTKRTTFVVTNIVLVRDPHTLESKRSFDIDINGLIETAISPDGQWLAIGDVQGNLHLWDVAAGVVVNKWNGHRDHISKVGFMGPGRVLTSSGDLTALLWELRPKERPTKPHWDTLTGRDAKEAYRALWAIADDPKGPELLRSKIAPAGPPPADKVKQLLADLGDDKFAVRETATKELQALGRLIEPDLRAARASVTNEEVRTRLDGLIARIPRERTGLEIVHARAVAAMEISGTESAKKLLMEWAAGTPGARLTIDAKAAFARLAISR